MFLDDLAKNLYMKPNTIREIRTPNGTKIRTLDDLQNNYTYIAVSRGEIFRSVNDIRVPVYNQIKKYSNNLKPLQKPHVVNNNDTDIENQINLSNKSNRKIGIRVFKNGDPYTRTIYVPFQQHTKIGMQYLFRAIEECVVLPSNKPIMRLYKMNGEEIKNISEIENRNCYVVASNEPFMNIKYGQELPVMKGGKILSGRRIFLNKPKEYPLKNIIHKIKKIKKERNSVNSNCTNKENFYVDIFEYIDKNIIGRDTVYRGPFGNRLLIYCDYTASGRPLKFMEDFIAKEVLPDYSNTHTTNTAMAMQTTIYRNEAREIIRNSCHALDNDVVIFAGNGCTGAIHKLVYNMNHTNAPIVLIGPFEHHSNILPWKNIAIRTYRIQINSNGEVDVDNLTEVLEKQSKLALEENRQIIGVFAAVSNVSGIITNVNLISAIIHKYNGFVFWDYASGAPYLPIDMNPVDEGLNKDLVYKDAVYFSVHKFVGGIQTPGILIAKKYLFDSGQCDPHGAGGGTVFFVGRESHLFLKEIEEREEGGTPNIVGDIRAGLTFQLKDAVTTEAILKREEYLVQYALSKFEKSKNLIVLGGFKTHRIPIFSLMFRHNISQHEYLFLHHHFVCSLLNDLFGIQSRSGCACAGPYGMDLLGIDEDLAEKYLSLLVGIDMKEVAKLSCIPDYPHRDLFKPGFLRFNLSYFMPDVDAEYVLNAVVFIAENGYKFLPLYKFYPETNEWKHRDHNKNNDIMRISEINYQNGKMNWNKNCKKINTEYPSSYNQVMKNIENIIKEIVETPISIPDESISFEECTEGLRWFLLPSEAASFLWKTPKVSNPSRALFLPGTLAPAFPIAEKKQNNLQNNKTYNTEIKEYEVDQNRNNKSAITYM